MFITAVCILLLIALTSAASSQATVLADQGSWDNCDQREGGVEV